MKHILPIIYLLCTFQIIMAQSDDNLYLSASTTPSAIEVFWLPLSPSLWQEHRSTGYTVTRSEIDDNGQVISSEVLYDALVEKDSVWVLNNADLANGIMEPIGGLLYDPTFQFPTNEIIDPLELKYDYIMEEVRNHTEVANAMGLGFEDVTAKPNVSYRYEVKSADGSLQTSVDIDNYLMSTSSYPSDYDLVLDLPHGQSFTDMYNAAFPIEQEYIRAIGKAFGDSIVLRWGLNSPKMWESAKEKGFDIYRTLNGADYQFVANVQPWPESDITEAIVEDSMALAAAGLLYGQSDFKGDGSLYEENAILENNLGFALYTADRSALAAEILGLRYVDNDVIADSTYIYLIGTEGIEDLWDAGKTTVVNIYETLAPPVDVNTTSKHQSIRIEWSKSENEDRFSSYNIERSEDGVNYTTLTPNKLVFMETAELPLYRYVYTDSVTNNGQDYYYRIYGYDAFGEKSQPAETVGQAVDLVPPLVADMGFSEYIDETDEIYLSWTYPYDQYEDLDYYQVMISEVSDGEYSALSEPFGPEVTEYVLPLKDIDSDRPFFFKIRSVDKSGNTSESILAQVVVPDLIAPVPPTEVNGFVDSFSFVHLSWEHSASEDVQGYWLYWGYDTIQEMTPVNKELLTENYYTYYLEKESLAKRMYYCVRAQDDSYNRGHTSEKIEVQRLDYIAPTTPYKFYTSSESDVIQINWQLSPDDDVVGQILYKNHENGSWAVLDSLDNDVQEFMDSEIEYGDDYSYFILAFDGSGNVSDTSAIRTSRVTFPSEKSSVHDLSVTSEGRIVTMNWDFQSDPKTNELPYLFEVFKSDGVGAPVFYAEVGSDKTFIDKEVQYRTIYNYAIRVRYENGWVGDLSDVKSVMIQ